VIFLSEGFWIFFLEKGAARNCLSILLNESIELDPFKRRADDVVGQVTG
jgi:hypothetical protein